MAASSSSGVGKISKGLQVFINFRGEELGNGFIAHLEKAFERANINYFIYKHEQVGKKFQNLSVRIEQSRVALMIFSKEYTTSVSCLDELVKIKECMDKGSLIGVPIFYKLKTSTVSNLQGYFGDNFRTLKRNNQQDLVRTQSWEEALTSTPQTVGMKLSEESDQTDREFIEAIVDKVKSLLEDIAMGQNVDQNRQEVNSQRSMIHARKMEITHSENPENWTWSSIKDPLYDKSDKDLVRFLRKVHLGNRNKGQNADGFSVPASKHILSMCEAPNEEAGEYYWPDEFNCLVLGRPKGNTFMIGARELSITWSEDSEHWTWLPLQNQNPNDSVEEIVYLRKASWLEVLGKFDTHYLSPCTRYEVVFVVMLEYTTFDWETPVKFKLVLPNSREEQQERSINMADHITNRWVDIPVGEFTTLKKNIGEISFAMYEYECQLWKSGLSIKGVAIRPKHCHL